MTHPQEREAIVSEVLITPETLLTLIEAAYVQGARDGDQADSFAFFAKQDFTETTRPYRSNPQPGSEGSDERVVQEMEYANSMRNMAAAFHAAMIEACDLLAEKRHGNPARSPGHNARLCLESALAAAPEPLRVAGEEVERAIERVREYAEWLSMHDRTNRLPADLRSVLALIEPSAGGGEPRKCWVLQRNNNPWAVYLNADEARAELASKRASEMRWREENIHVADVRTYWNLFEVPVSPTPDQPKPEVKDV